MSFPPLSLALSGLNPASLSGASLREQIPWTRKVGFAAVHLNATAPGVRPRELDRSARRDIAAVIRREGLGFSGLDLWIPAEHFTDLAQLDRAITALLASIELAAELSPLVRGTISATNTLPVISLSLPATASDETLTSIAAAADRAGVRIADHAIPFRDLTPRNEPAISIGLDPAAALSAGLDPSSFVSTLGPRLASARLSDVSRTIGGGRVLPGSKDGKLDLLAYSVALVTADYPGYLCIDTRALPGPEAPQSALQAFKRIALP